MAKFKLREKDLIKIGYPKGKAIALAMNLMRKHYSKYKKDEVLLVLQDLINQPENYIGDEILGRVVNLLDHSLEDQHAAKQYKLKDELMPYRLFGAKHINDNARQQMEVAMRLPVAVGGALMPDAHHGYGLPIGGVLATENAIIPYAVGVDIGCRMCLTIYDLPASFIGSERYNLKRSLMDCTRFGKHEFKNPMDDEVLERKEFDEIPFLKKMKTKAYRQIGSSGSGNHFVEFGIVSITELDNQLQLPIGEYVGVLSHSGSRGVGASIAQHYTNRAMEQCQLPSEARNLSWLELSSEEGMEYWLAMNLAGDYATACHNQIHKRLAKTLGQQPLATVENHHNFAWKETLADNREVIVHRKGATPAGKGVMGIIPGSMTASAYIVCGKGEAGSFKSASHGAGRAMSRTKAKNSVTKSELRKYLKKMGVDLIGGGVDEAPMAYKNIEEVMASQTDLVDVVGTFVPKVVRMDKSRR